MYYLCKKIHSKVLFVTNNSFNVLFVKHSFEKNVLKNVHKTKKVIKMYYLWTKIHLNDKNNISIYSFFKEKFQSNLI